MRITRRRNRSGSGQIPVSSFSDIAFLLIIFFILTTTLEKPMAFLSEIPSGQKGQTQQAQTTTIALHDNEIRLNDEEVTMDKLRRELRDMHLEERTGEDKIVLLEASGEVRYQNYFETMSIVSAAGGSVAIVREGE